MKRFGSTTWNGGLREGKGAVSTESRALESYPTASFLVTARSPAPTPKNCSAHQRRVLHHVVCQNARNGKLLARAGGQQIGGRH